MDVSIIIVNYHTSKLISDCIESIIEKTLNLKYEVIILDNDSEPDFKEIIGKRIPRDLESLFKFIYLKENIGFGRANNEGAKYATGRNLLFLNPDTILKNNAIKILSDFLDNQSKIGICGGNIISKNEEPTFSFWRIFPGVRYDMDLLLSSIPSKIRYGKNLNYNYTSKPLKVAYVIGADLMIKHDLFKRLNGFRKEYFMFSEEVDLCLRAKRLGEEIYNVPTAKIIHLEGGSFTMNVYPGDNRLQLMEESRILYLKLNHNKTIRFFSDLISRLYYQSRIILTNNYYKKDFFKRKYKIFKRYQNE